MRLANKIGLVTAAGSGMGRAGAIRFAKEGACVGVVDLDQAAVNDVVAEIEAAGGKAIGIACDLRDDANARRIVKEIADAFGGLDFVWNHVGHPGPAAVEGIDMADYDLAMDLNVRSVLVTTEAALPELRVRGGGGAALYGLNQRPEGLSIQPGLCRCQVWRGWHGALVGGPICQGQNPRERRLPWHH